MKKVLSIFLSVVMLLSITASIDINAYAASYNSDYRRWSQGKSSYSWMKGYGCWVVAESKLIYETGINKSSSFNPDVYYKWVTDKGYVNNSGNVYCDNPVRYAKAMGNNKLSYKGMSTSDLSNKVINNAKSGYYSIIKVSTSNGGTHYIMANNSKIKSTGNIYIYDSWNSSNEPPATFAWSDIKSKVGCTYTMKAVYTFQYSDSSTVTKPSVSVKAVSDVTSSSAQINFTANNPSKVTIKTVGVQVRKKGDPTWTTKTEAMNSSYVNANSVPMWWTVGKGKEVNMTLSAGTTYEYRAYVVYNGANYYSSISSFTTKGHSHNYSDSKITTSPTCVKNGVRTYYCSCGAAKTETIPQTGHEYQTVTTKATLSKNGSIVTKCSACGDVSANTTIYYPKTVELNRNTFTVNGEIQKPTVIVKDVNGIVLTLNRDYTVHYSNANSTNAGKYTVTMNFQGNYSGTKTLAYQITEKPAHKWIKNGNRWWYRHADGSYTKNNWEKINGKWYHFDNAGWMQTGWLKTNNKWYYLSGSGAMLTGWQKVNNVWYYMSASGAMTTGWQKVSNKWYYMNASGAMQTGWQKINGDWYCLSSSGAMYSNQWVGNYYVDASGRWTKTR